MFPNFQHIQVDFLGYTLEVDYNEQPDEWELTITEASRYDTGEVLSQSEIAELENDPSFMAGLKAYIDRYTKAWEIEND